MSTLFEAGVRILIFLCLLGSFQALLGEFGPVGGGVSIHDTNFVNTVCTLHPEVSYGEIPLHLYYIMSKVPFEIFLPSTHGATYGYFGVVRYMHGGEGLA